MTSAGPRILAAAMDLPHEDRTEFAVILLDSLGGGRSTEDIDAAWIVEIRRRLEEVRSGRATLIPSEDVERELDELIHAAAHDARTLLKQALSLPDEERLRLAEALFDSLPVDAHEQIDQAWREEILRRMAEVRRGEVELESWEDVRRAGRQATDWNSRP